MGGLSAGGNPEYYEEGVVVYEIDWVDPIKSEKDWNG